MMRTYKHPGVHWLGMAWISLSVTQSWEVYNHSVILQSGKQFLAHSYETALLPCKDFTTIVTHIYVKVLFKINSSLCSLGICSQWSPLSLCTVHSIVLLHRRWKELAGFGGLSMEIKREKTYASHKCETSWSKRAENAIHRASANQQTKTTCLWSRKQLLFLLCPCLARVRMCLSGWV